jgi:hypothetical protein
MATRQWPASCTAQVLLPGAYACKPTMNNCMRSGKAHCCDVFQAVGQQSHLAQGAAYREFHAARAQASAKLRHHSLSAAGASRHRAGRCAAAGRPISIMQPAPSTRHQATSQLHHTLLHHAVLPGSAQQQRSASKATNTSSNNPKVLHYQRNVLQRRPTCEPSCLSPLQLHSIQWPHGGHNTSLHPHQMNDGHH